MVLATLCPFFKVQGQTNFLIKGRVIDSATNSPLIGATVRIKTTQILNHTDKQGEFTLSSKSISGMLNVSFIGYKTKELSFSAENQHDITISLTDDRNNLKEVSVVSTGYQTLPKDRATGSFATVDNELYNRRTSSDVLSKLEGVVPGLLFNRNTAVNANGTNDINIRGRSTLLSNDQPLIVMDGFPYQGDLNNINPNDIDNVTVLKDAAAASIWGVRSGNGVIVLTTKKGKENQKLKIELNANVTFAKKPDLHYDPNFLGSGDYIDIEKLLFNQGYFDSQIGDPTQVISPVVQIFAKQRSGSLNNDDANAVINNLRAVDSRDGLSKYFYRKSVNQQYNLNIRGGGLKSDYYISVGEDHLLSNLTGNSNNRFTLSSNFNFYPTKDLRINIGSRYTISNQWNNSQLNNIGVRGNLGNHIYPYTQFADPNGNSLATTKNYNLDFVNTAQQADYLDWNYRPLDEQSFSDNQISSRDNLLNFGVNYKIIKGLNADLKYQFENSNGQSSNYYSLDSYYARNLINEYSQKNANGSITYPIPVGGILQQSNGFLNAYQARAQLNYNNVFGNDHEVTAILGAELNSTINKSNSNTAYGYNKNTESSTSKIDFADLFNLNPDLGTGQIPNNQNLSKTTDHFVSYFGNASYSYKQRYIVSLSGRVDKSNLFGVATNNKAVPLFSSGIAWDLSKEQFYHVDWLPDLKIRATYGYNANINKSATAVTTLLQLSNSYFNGQPYNEIANPGNPELRWEKDRMINLGIDFASKKNIISGSFDYFLKRSTDLFGPSPLPPSTGVINFFGNTASTAGHGFDLVLNSQNVSLSNFTWSSNFLLSYVIDKVKSYSGDYTVIDYLRAGAESITPITDRPTFGIYSFKTGTLTHDTGDPQGYIYGQISTDYANIIAKTTVSDLYYNGASRPTTFGSFRNNFRYKSWSLSANLIFKLNYYFRRTSTSLSYVGIAYGGWNSDYSKRWQKPGDESSTTVPSIQLPPSNNDRETFYDYSQTLVDRGDHIRLQDIRLAYEMKFNLASKLKINHLTLFAYLNNVGIIWRANKDHLDPDLFTGSLPLPLTISLGLNTNF